MQPINVLLLASAALGSVIPTARDPKAAFLGFPAIHGWRGAAARDTAGQILKPENFAHVQEDRRRFHQGWEGRRLFLFILTEARGACEWKTLEIFYDHAENGMRQA
ncbi:hypothetical protein GGR53DRAFT_467204 [Hypoxylon sp. FL1150]|nr:hypothetical protein GGR53DRAFT_467204 [Hypoxylon sp. FL1150]